MTDNAESRPASGIRLPTRPPEGSSPLEVAQHYVRFYEREIARTRRVLKRRATLVVVVTAVSNAAIAIVGSATAAWNIPQLGVVSAVLAGVITVVAAWDGLYRHREHWVLRSAVLNQLNALNRSVELRAALAQDHQTIAIDAMNQVDEIMAADQTAWNELRKRQLAPSNMPTEPSG